MVMDLAIREEDAPRPQQVLLSCQIPSRPDRKMETLDTISDALIRRGCVREDDREWLVMCLDEALVNAMLHGNEGDPDASVVITVFLEPKRWVVIIDDQGSGFQADAVPDGEDALLLEHGRGIRLMRAWLDELTFYRSGATILMARRCEPLANDSVTEI